MRPNRSTPARTAARIDVGSVTSSRTVSGSAGSRAVATTSLPRSRAAWQGARPNPSDITLDALADGLRLNRVEREHLQALADQARGRQPLPRANHAMRPGLLRTLQALAPTPAVVLGRLCEVVAWNRTGAALDPVVAALPAPQRNVARRVVLDPSARSLYPQWDALAQEVADVLRFNAARFPDDADLAALVEELLGGSPEFGRFW